MTIRLSDGSTLALATRRVHSYFRNEHGRLEHVRGYLAQAKKPGPAFHGWIEKAKGWIPEPKWEEGQQEWVDRGEKSLHGGPPGHEWAIKSPSGDIVAPGAKQLTFPGMPHPPIPHEMSEAEERSRLKSAMASGEVSERTPGEDTKVEQGGQSPSKAEGNDYFGNSGEVRDVTFKDGSEWISKRLAANVPYGPGVQQANEILASRVSEAIGAGAPPVIESGNTLWEPKVDGEPAIEWVGGTDENGDPIGPNDPEDMYLTPQGQRIGVLDILLANQDRHYGNWLVAKDTDGKEYPVPIDHGLSFLASSTDSDFSMATDLEAIPAATWDMWKTRLDKLAVKFAAWGMSPEYQKMMSRFDAMKNGEVA